MYYWGVGRSRPLFNPKAWRDTWAPNAYISQQLGSLQLLLATQYLLGNFFLQPYIFFLHFYNFINLKTDLHLLFEFEIWECVTDLSIWK